VKVTNNTEPEQNCCQASVFRRSLATGGYTPRANHPLDGWSWLFVR